jgi:serine/threonine protein kinase
VPNPAPGTILGAYRVEGSIGAGSMGEVFRGIDTGLNRRVAIKILSEKHRDSPELRARFVREGRAVAAISHPNVVQVFATGIFDERPYIAMELLDGTDLGSAVEAKGPLSTIEAAHAILDAAQGLAAASRAGLIHRDVKPSNVIVTPEDHVYLTDFGLAKRAETEAGLTAADQVLGTVDYVAPEQIEGSEPDARSDVYSLGCVLYEMLTGEPPFAAHKGGMAKMWAQVNAEVTPLSERRSDVPPAIDELVRRSMAKDPATRPTAEQFERRALRAIGEEP